MLFPSSPADLSGYYTGTLQVALGYDPLGRLYDTSGGASGTTRFLQDGDQIVDEYDGAGTRLRRYVDADGVDDPLLWYEGSASTPYRLFKDHLGSVVLVTQNDGTPVAFNGYDEFGVPKNSVDSSASPYGRFGYTGQAWLPDLGMSYYKARIYSPTMGRFMQTDPIGYADGMNWYDYVGGDPVNGSDPSGMALCPEGQVAVFYGQGTPTYTNDQGDIIVTSRPHRCVTMSRAQGAAPGSGSSGGSSGTNKATPQKEQTITQSVVKWWDANKGCLAAVGGGALTTAIDPISLVATGTTGLITSAGAISRAAFPVGRALTIARAAVPGFLIGEGVLAVLGGAKAYFTDQRCR